MRPNVAIIIGNGNLSQTLQTSDGVCGMVLTGVAAGEVTLNDTNLFFSLEEAENKGITDALGNGFAHKQIKDFYSQAGSGAELWVMLAPSGISMSHILDENSDFAQKLLLDANGAIRFLGVSTKNDGAPVIQDGLNQEVGAAVPVAQTLATSFTNRNRPIRILLDGKDFNGNVADLKDYTTDNKNRVSILIGNDDFSTNASIGLVMGRKAANPVQRNVGRVKDGPIIEPQAYFTDGEASNTKEPQWDAIHNKGYMFFLSYVGKAGFFLNDMPTLTSSTDDYNDQPKGFVIDKAHLIAYATFIEEILDEIPVAEDGTIHPALIKGWETKIEGAIAQNMLSNGEISGVDAFIDVNQNILGTNKLKVILRILPLGYAKYIEVDLGFSTQLNN